MFCSKCGAENSKDTKFCGHCGLDISNSGVASGEAHQFIFYSKNWRGAHVLPLGLWNGSGYYDIAIDNEYVYFLKFPSYSSGFWWGLIGFFTLSLIGLFIGAAYGGSVDTRKREGYRSTWLNSDMKITSRNYEAAIFQKVSKLDLKNVAVFKKRAIVFSIGEKNYIFKTSTKEFQRFTNILN